MSALDALVDRLPRTTLVVGKGGVGKTTCATTIATMYAARGERTLLISTDPAAALADVVGAPVSTDAAPVRGKPNLDARQLSASRLREDFLGKWRDVIAEIIDRGTYLDRGDVDGLVDAAFPGADEIFALLALADILADPSKTYARIVVDTAPTGHTLRLLALPETFQALVSMLDLMQDKHRFTVRALTHRYRRDRADAFLDNMRARIDALRAALADERSLAAVLVTRDEPVVQSESERYLADLAALSVHVGAVIVNAADGESHVIDASIPHYYIPRWTTRPGRTAKRRPAGEVVELHRLARTLTIVGGKGGVGKSTVACALAVAAVDADGESTLLVSTDPAPSIADVLGASTESWARADDEHAVADVPGLVVRQMDAAAAFTRLREQYQERIDSLFEALLGRGIDIEHDRAILRELLALAPPGVDELFALSALGDTLEEQRFQRIFVDPAPTGHLLRLLEMPALALDWTHQLMRLMLKYREAGGLGDTAQDLLDFARRTRALDALMHDHDRCAVVLVALDEPVVRSETERLCAAVRERNIELAALVWNRVRDSTDPLPASVTTPQYCAKEVTPPPIGVTALRDWSRSWHELTARS